jgi:hypothetical protein
VRSCSCVPSWVCVLVIVACHRRWAARPRTIPASTPGSASTLKLDHGSLTVSGSARAAYQTFQAIRPANVATKSAVLRPTITGTGSM